jgi:GT2 family glycosyltransferase
MKLSIVTAYYNRRILFETTLRTIARSRLAAQTEVIAVDDASRDDQRIDDLGSRFGVQLRVIRVLPEAKWWCNPCVPFNIGFQESRGQIVILQNPECLHAGDVLTSAFEAVRPGRYVTYGCYSADAATTAKLAAIDFEGANLAEDIRRSLEPMTHRGSIEDGESAWYNHSVFKPTNLHFCAAISRSDLLALGGFDERYALGVAFDDNEWLARVRRCGLDVITLDNPFVVHQYHGKTNYAANPAGYVRNASLFQGATSRESGHRVLSKFFTAARGT